jgi:hypothetical protein
MVSIECVFFGWNWADGVVVSVLDDSSPVCLLR